jgi:hypothetical protein
MLVSDKTEWEDIILFISKEEAIQYSIKYPLRRVEIFSNCNNCYLPTYNYYQNGDFKTNL